MKINNNYLLTYPSVCAVRKDYIICVPVKKNVIMNLTVGKKTYYNHSNGVKISDTPLQKFKVPMAELDKYKKYKIDYTPVIKRLAYRSILGDKESLSFDFKPVEDKEEINICHISDTHGRKQGTLKAVKNENNIDLLILNGDISSSSDCVKDIMLSYILSGEITKGEYPVIISRGNHDLRGKYAEKLPSLMPTDNGKSYYPVSLGPLWCVLLDTGEDKEDSHPEYGGTVCCHQFRLEQSEMLEELKKNSKNEYNSENIKYKFILSHVPFSNDNTVECKGERPFNIEKEIFTDWCNFAKNEVNGMFHLCGHLHYLSVEKPNSDFDTKKIGIPIILGGTPVKESKTDIECSVLTLKKEKVIVSYRNTKNTNHCNTEFTI